MALLNLISPNLQDDAALTGRSENAHTRPLTVLIMNYGLWQLPNLSTRPFIENIRRVPRSCTRAPRLPTGRASASRQPLVGQTSAAWHHNHHPPLCNVIPVT